jgi:hypothetical protein
VAQVSLAISSVQVTGSSGDYTVTVDGSGFGPSPVSLPYTGDTGYFRIGDMAQFGHGEWGYTGDANQLTYQSWSDSQIVVSGVGAAPGDGLMLAVWGRQTGDGAVWGGHAPPIPSAPSISGVSFSGSGQDLSITVTGSGFGAAPVAMPYTGDLNDFFFWDARSHCGGGSSQFSAGGSYFGDRAADSVPLAYTYWSDTQIVVSGFGTGYGSGCNTVDPGDPVGVGVWASSDTTDAGAQTAWGGNLPSSVTVTTPPVTEPSSTTSSSTSSTSTSSTTTGTTCVPIIRVGFYVVTPVPPSCITLKGDVYTSTGPVMLDGLKLSPITGTVGIVVDNSQSPPLIELDATNVSVGLGPYTVYMGPIASVSLTASFDIDTNAVAKLGGLLLKGDLKLTATTTDGFEIDGDLTLPSALGGGTVAFEAALSSTGALTGVTVSAAGFTISVAGQQIGLKNFSLSYDWSADTWTGTATVELPTPDATPVAGGSVSIVHGQLTNFSVSADDLNVPLGPGGVFLQSIGATISVGSSPSISGSAGLTAGPTFSYGGQDYAFITAGGSAGYMFTSPGEFWVSGSLVLLQGSHLARTLASGSLEYYTNGQVSMSGNIGYNVGPVSLDAALKGWATSAAFALTGSASLSIAGYTLGSATAVVSNVGIAACASALGGLVEAGFGYVWGGSLSVMGRSCSLGPYTPQEPATLAQSGFLTGHLTPVMRDLVPAGCVPVLIPPGLTAASVRLTGGGSAPVGTLTGPRGEVIVVNADRQGEHTRGGLRYAVAVDQAHATSYVLLGRPQGGRWLFVPDRGYSVSSSAVADALPQPSVTGTVTGTGLARTFGWHLARIPYQRVTFVEEGAHVDRILAANVSAASGSVSFAPATGPAGTRTVWALVTQNGLVGKTIRVAQFKTSGAASLQLSVSHGGGAKGFVDVAPGGPCSSSCVYTVPLGQRLTLTPRPKAGARFTWTGGACVGRSTCKLKVSQDVTAAGKFSRRR